MILYSDPPHSLRLSCEWLWLFSSRKRFAFIYPTISSCVSPDGHVISWRHAGGVAQGGMTTTVLFSLYINDISSPSQHVDLDDTEDTAIIAKSRKSKLLVSNLES